MLVTAKSQIYAISGPIIKIAGPTEFSMQEMVYVGDDQLIGEIIGITDEETTIQVYEETAGLTPGEWVYGTDLPMKVQLGPGLLNNIYDGIERPLKEIEKQSGYFIKRGVNVKSLNTDKKWPIKMKVSVGEHVRGGSIIAEVDETAAITHKVMVPPNTIGEVIEVVPDGDYSIEDPLIKIKQFDGTITPIKAYQEFVHLALLLNVTKAIFLYLLDNELLIPSSQLLKVVQRQFLVVSEQVKQQCNIKLPNMPMLILLSILVAENVVMR